MPYGCAEFDDNPFGNTIAEGVRNFCRFRGADIVPDSVQWKFCTLPDIEATSPFVYGSVGYSVNGFYSEAVGVTPIITSKHSSTHQFFSGYESAKNNWNSIAAPAGDEKRE